MGNQPSNDRPSPAPSPPPSNVDPATAWLHAHNVYRCIHDVPEMEWDSDLERAAQKWADRGDFSHSSSSWRQSEAGFAAGENLATASYEQSPAEATKAWYAEIELTDGGVVKSFTSGTGHYTQVVWKTSTKLGCGSANGGMGTLNVCQYAEPGNFQGRFEENVLPPTKDATECGDPSAPQAGTGTMRNVVICVLGIVLLLILCCVCRAVDRARKNAEGIGAKMGMGHHGAGQEFANEISHPVNAVQDIGGAVISAVQDPGSAISAVGQDVNYVVHGGRA